MGLCGKVYSSKSTFISNDVLNEKGFTSGIDNLTSIREVKNIMIGPVFAHSSKLREDNTRAKFDRSLPIGIIQLINKNNREKITEYDIQKFE